MPGVSVVSFSYAFRYSWLVPRAVEFALRELDYLLITAAPAADTAAFIVEPVFGEGGYVPTPPEFRVGLYERADRHGILLIADEVADRGRPDRTVLGPSAHPGRHTGHPDHSEGHRQRVSDLRVERADEQAWSGSQGGTDGGNPVACAAALASLDILRDENLVDNAAEQGNRLLKELHKVAADHPGIADVRGLGLMVGNEFCAPDGTPDTATAAWAHAAAGRETWATATHLRRAQQRGADDPAADRHRSAGRRRRGAVGGGGVRSRSAELPVYRVRASVSGTRCSAE